MEVPAEVRIHNELLGLKGAKGTLLQIGDGYYELNCPFGERIHRVLLPMASTVLIPASPRTHARDPEIER